MCTHAVDSISQEKKQLSNETIRQQTIRQKTIRQKTIQARYPKGFQGIPSLLWFRFAKVCSFVASPHNLIQIPLASLKLSS